MKRPYLLGSLIGIGLLVVSAPGPARADTVVKTNGESITGRILKADKYEVQIEAGGIVLRLPRDEVADMHYDQDEAKVTEEAVTIRTLTEQGRVFAKGEALDRLKGMAALPDITTNDFVVGIARRVGDAAFRRLQYVLDQRDPAPLVEDVVKLKDPALDPFWRAAYPGEEYPRKFLAGLNQYLGAAALLKGRAELEGPQQDLDAARRDFAQAAELLGKQPFLNDGYVSLADYRWALFWQLRTVKEQLEKLPVDQRASVLPLSQAAIEELFSSARQEDAGLGQPRVPMSADLFENLQYLEKWFKDNQLAFVTKLEPTPVPPPTFGAIWTPLPTATPTPVPTPSASGVLGDAISDVTKGRILQAWSKIKQNMGILGVYLTPALYGLGALIAWILIPRMILRFRERRGDLEAARFRSWPKISGPLALIGYLVVITKNRPKRAKHKCPFCNYTLDDIESYADMNFVACPNCHQTITPVYDLEDYIEYLVEAVKRELEMSKMGAVNLKAVIEKDAMTKLVRALITLAVRRRASDLHVEPEGEGVKIRARIDGMLQELTTMPKVMASPLVSALKVMGNLDIAERRVPQDGRFQMWVDKADIDIRIASAPSAHGEKCTLRLLDSRSITVDASRLGMEPDGRAIFEKIIRAPHGMLLVTGPTGSGKSTTLYVALQQINTGEKNIISIEDPIEFKIKGVNQMQVNNAANFTFATGLRSVLRQDPDVIMIGEVRDRETADIAIEAAMTGHLVLSTLHTIDSASAIGRLVDLNVEPRRFADALQLIIAQRLLRINCTECGKPYKPKKSEWDAVGLTEEQIGENQWKTLKGLGCDVCRFTGFFGRMGLFEFLIPDEEIRALIENRANTGKIRQAAKNKGMNTLREQGLERAKEGVTTLEEVIRVTA